MTRIKVCGITSSADALSAVEAGATYLGFNFYPRSPRFVSAEVARGIVELIPRTIVPVGIFVNEVSPERVLEIMEASRVELAQLHGDESADYSEKVGRSRVIKAFRAGPGFDEELAAGFPASAILLDAWVPDQFGGTGKTADWALAKRLAARRRLFLAGGIGPGNVVEAVRQVSPYAVDLNSAVEKSPGIKDVALMKTVERNLKGTAADHLGPVLRS